MSLTSHLRQKGAVHTWMRAQFPIEKRKAVLRECRPILTTATTLLPKRAKSDDGGYPYATVGTALDYRLRLYFAPFPQELVAHQGARILTDKRFRFEFLFRGGVVDTARPSTSVPTDVVAQFFVDLTGVVERLAPAGRVLSRIKESELARFCVVLAHFEALYRAGPHINSPLMGASSPQSVAELLALCPSDAASDMAALSRIFGKNCGDLIALGAQVKQNPTFAGSRLIGGADADFIANGCLWDIKTTIRSYLNGEWLYQLLGYVLLDFEDEHRIREVGIYMARQGVQLRWPLDELLDAVGVGGPSKSPIKTRLRRLREKFRALLEKEEAERATRRKAQLLVVQEEMRVRNQPRQQAIEAQLAEKAEERRAANRERYRRKN